MRGLEKVGSPDDKFQYNAQTEKDEDIEMYETPFRGYDPARGRFDQVDLLAPIIPSISPFAFSFNNPISFVDPTGLMGEDEKNKAQAPNAAPSATSSGGNQAASRQPAISFPTASSGGGGAIQQSSGENAKQDSPYYDKDGNFLGIDEKGFSGEVFITDRATFDKYEGKDGKVNSNKIQSSSNTQSIRASNLSWEAQSKIYTHSLMQMDIEDVNFDRLYNKKVSIANKRLRHTIKNGIKYYKGFNDPDGYSFMGTGYPDGKYNSNGRIRVTVSEGLYVNDLYTVELIQSFLGIHEFKKHGLDLCSGEETFLPKGQIGTHWKAYQAQLSHSTFRFLPKSHQELIKERVKQYKSFNR